MVSLENGKSSSETYIIKTDDSNMNSTHISWKFWKQRRYVVAVLALLGFFNAYALRINLSIAIVAMTEVKNVTSSNGTSILTREFDWDTKLQGYVLSSFFYGYAATQIIGGYIATRFGGKHPFGLGVAVTSFFTLLTPWVAEFNVYLLLAVRIIEGLFEGVTYPCLHALWSQWAPPLERSRLFTFAHSGSYIGTIISMPLSSYLATAFGWSSIFYFFGVLGLIWYAFWLFIVASDPFTDSKISPEELKYITQSQSVTSVSEKTIVPWRAIITSVPIWAIVAAHIAECWGFYTLLTELPKFMSNLLNFDLTKTGFLSSLPYFVMVIMLYFTGPFADILQARNILNTTNVRKVFTCGAFIVQGIALLLAVFVLSPVGTTAFICVAVGIASFAWAGFSVNHLDIAPQYAGVLMGFTNTFGSLPGIISPIITGYIVTDEANLNEWRIVFYIAAGIYFGGAIIYAIFASGEVQPWAVQQNNAQEEVEPPTSKL